MKVDISSSLGRGSVFATTRGGDRLIVSLDEPVAEDWHQRDSAHHESPDRQFDRAWALTVLERALIQLEAEQTTGERSPYSKH